MVFILLLKTDFNRAQKGITWRISVAGGELLLFVEVLPNSFSACSAGEVQLLYEYDGRVCFTCKFSWL